MLLGSGLFVLFVWLIFMVAALWFNGGMVTGKLWYAILNSFVFLLVAAAIAILLSAAAPSDTVANVLLLQCNQGRRKCCN